MKPTDTDRLNFLEKELMAVGYADPHVCYDHDGVRGEKYFELQMANKFVTEDTLREAIDRAIRETPK